MNEKEIIQHLREAKKAHLGWVARAHALIKGKPVDKEKVPVLPTECIFGKWYYSDGRQLANLQTYRVIEGSHNELHKIYADIFNLLFEKKKGSFFSRLTGQYKKQQKENLQKANQLFTDLQKMSDNIINKLDALEKEIREIMNK